jgi:hypothetical protein
VESLLNQDSKFEPWYLILIECGDGAGAACCCGR